MATSKLRRAQIGDSVTDASQRKPSRRSARSVSASSLLLHQAGPPLVSLNLEPISHTPTSEEDAAERFAQETDSATRTVPVSHTPQSSVLSTTPDTSRLP